MTTLRTGLATVVGIDDVVITDPRLYDDVWSWRDEALCAQTDPDEWYPEQGASPRQAKSVCRTCPVRVECLAEALDTAEPHGVWGGLTEKQRRTLRKPERWALLTDQQRATVLDHWRALSPYADVSSLVAVVDAVLTGRADEPESRAA